MPTEPETISKVVELMVQYLGQSVQPNRNNDIIVDWESRNPRFFPSDTHFGHVQVDFSSVASQIFNVAQFQSSTHRFVLDSLSPDTFASKRQVNWAKEGF